MTGALRRAAVLAALLLPAWFGMGCASTPPAGSTASMGLHPSDPWETFNRKIFAFNDALDEAILKPVATAYRDTVPELVRRGVDNVLGNIGDIWSTANHLLQGKLQTSLEMGTRVAVNTFIGLGGLLDPATEMRLPRRSEDFGQTLGHWGAPPGPYLVWPLLGPRTVRDSFGMALDLQFEPNRLPPTEAGRYVTAALAVINTRTNLLSASDLMNQIALDRYIFLRDAYLQRRLDQVYDGAPPLEMFDDEPNDDKARK